MTRKINEDIACGTSISPFCDFLKGADGDDANEVVYRKVNENIVCGFKNLAVCDWRR